jgi:hypothetical protein
MRMFPVKAIRYGFQLVIGEFSGHIPSHLLFVSQQVIHYLLLDEFIISRNLPLDRAVLNRAHGNVTLKNLRADLLVEAAMVIVNSKRVITA